MTVLLFVYGELCSCGERGNEMDKKKIVKEIVSWLGVLVVACLLALVVTKFVIIKAIIPSGSMENTVMKGNRLIGLRVAYLFSEPEREDIIIFKFPDNEKENYIKRVIGLPGETVEIIDGTLYIDGKEYEEDYLKEPMRGSFGPYEVPEGHYFVMGDNRNHSEDARVWKNTYVAEEKIIAKAWLRYKPNLEFLK